MHPAAGGDNGDGSGDDDGDGAPVTVTNQQIEDDMEAKVRGLMSKIDKENQSAEDHEFLKALREREPAPISKWQSLVWGDGGKRR
jgi:hypothetical protein